MSTVRRIHISLFSKEEALALQTDKVTRGSYSIDVQAGEDWIVTGKYRENSLCALELKRISKTEAKE